MRQIAAIVALVAATAAAAEQDPSSPSASTRQDPWKPYSPPCVERENVFEFTEKPKVKNLGNDKYEITFAVKGNCDVTVGIVDSDPSTGSAGSPQAGSRLREDAAAGTAGQAEKGVVVRHLASGVLGANAPTPFQKNSLKQTLVWNGKDDLDVYHKTPEKLKVRVMLGLKPVFDKRLGGTSPKNLPGHAGGLVIGPDGVYVFMIPGAFGHGTIRKFDHDGNYVRNLVPPSADMPESKLGGMGYMEYEPGKRALQGTTLSASFLGSWFLPTLNNGQVLSCQPALAGNMLVYATEGGRSPSMLYYTYTDGSTDARGMKGLRLVSGTWLLHWNPKLTASPDGKTVYMTGANDKWQDQMSTCVYVRSLESEGPAKVFAGDPKKPGSDDSHFMKAQGIDCDAAGRVYVADEVNNRIQVFSPEVKHLKTIPLDRPNLLCVHKKTGAIYVQHQARVQGRSVRRITKLNSFADPREELHFDGMMGLMALDSWTEKPRLWFSGVLLGRGGQFAGDEYQGPDSVTIWEERPGMFEKIMDFEEEAKKETGGNWIGRWGGDGVASKSVCDPTREKLFYKNHFIFDLATGKHEGALRLPGATDDIAFDKRGYMHAHFNPCFFMEGVGRFDSRRGSEYDDWTKQVHKGQIVYPECPYDYGIEKGRFIGVLPVKDQPGAKGFQDGMGVNMMGDVASECNIYYVPRMDDYATAIAYGTRVYGGPGGDSKLDHMGGYPGMLRSWQDQEKKGEEVFSIKRQPGIPLAGATVWTFKRNGELQKKCAVIAGDLINGVMLDEDLSVYFVNARPRVYGGKPFLYGKGGHFGDPASKHLPFTGTVIKTKPDTPCRVLLKNAPIPMDTLPARPPEVATRDTPENDVYCWVEGAEWLYAGASPIVDGGCECPAQRLHLDWYKRTYVPESYRHSIGILDTNGNLIMHVGRYANFDSAPGGKDGCKPGETDIGLTCVRYIGGTDNYLAFEDYGERLVVLKLKYQAEETVGISNQ